MISALMSVELAGFLFIVSMAVFITVCWHDYKKGQFKE